MTLYEKIITLYPGLKSEDFVFGLICLQNDLDERGDYIENWNHPDYPRPTDDQLASVGN